MASSSSLYKRQQQTQQTNETPISPKLSSNAQPRSIISFFTPTGLFILLTLIVIFGVFLSPWMNDTLMPSGLFSRGGSVSKWKDYTLFEAVNFVSGGRNGSGTVIVCAKWPGHAVLIPPAPAPENQSAHKFGSRGFFNFTSRRPRHLLHILELGYNVMYNDVDMVWLADPFTYLKGDHDVYFTDDMTAIKPLKHSMLCHPLARRGVHTFVAA
ncbi:hypothetical protein MKW98_025167 [Papaver atlanticum]|uniref:Nucleotide-diphospho-sugar transferase domain-containing protein n=1 Tax=Papaver atlanticum TaxID=357466 RepID=A0AAD4S1N4_9MAGN|nr:hypothetical protein MKW98_025167 [Papaver atlanticum]